MIMLNIKKVGSLAESRQCASINSSSYELPYNYRNDFEGKQVFVCFFFAFFVMLKLTVEF